VKRLPANTQIKLLIFLSLIAGGFYFIQTRYNIFEISPNQAEVEQEKTTYKIWVKNSKGEQFAVDTELAVTQSEKNKGLSSRQSLGTNSGMLFVYENDSLGGFWMKDTVVPLDMIFTNEKGEILYIEQNAQPCDRAPCKVYNPSIPYRYVLEVNGFWTRDRGVKVGDKIEIPDFTSDS